MDKYESLEDLSHDLDLTFNNAKQYNISTSRLYKDADRLQKLMHVKLKELDKMEAKVITVFIKFKLLFTYCIHSDRVNTLLVWYSPTSKYSLNLLHETKTSLFFVFTGEFWICSIYLYIHSYCEQFNFGN